MYVYTLNDGCSSYDEVIGIYSTKKKAQNALKAYKKENPTLICNAYICKWEVDKEDLGENGLRVK